MRALFYLIFIAGIGNTVLRPEMENPYTLYRLLAPIGLLAVLAFSPKLVGKALAFFLVFAVYSFVLATLYSGDLTQFWPSLVHYLYILVLLIVFIYVKRGRGFDLSFLRFVEGFYVFLLLNLALEAVVGSYYPNLYVDQSEELGLRAFFWNQNDLAVVICVIAWIVLCLDRYKIRARLLVSLITIAILYFNDSKAALLSFVLATIPLSFVFMVRRTVRISHGVWFFIFGLLSILFVGGLFALADSQVAFSNKQYSVGELLVRPILSILTLQPSGEEWGSLNNRTDAAIFVIIEYIKTYGLGLGAGGSWLVLSLPQYTLKGAQSPHNALLQFIVDFGYPVLIGYAVLIRWALRNLFTYRLEQVARLKVMAVLSFPLLGLSQSGAILTNYFFWGGVFFIALLKPGFDRERVVAKADAPAQGAQPVALNGVVA